MKVSGKIIPLKDKVLVSDMDFGEERTASGIYIPSDNGKTTGIHPRWGRVWAIGPEQRDVRIGEWVLIEHGRWTRTIEVDDNGNNKEVRMVDNNAIMAASEQRPSDVMRVS